MRYRCKTDETLDTICLNHYGKTHHYVEAILQANPGLASLGPILPVGTVIELPELTNIQDDKPMIRLWD